MVRIFYLTLYACTFAAATVVWPEDDDQDTFLELVGARQANAQSPDGYPTTSGYTPAASAANTSGYPNTSTYPNTASPTPGPGNAALSAPFAQQPMAPTAASRPAGWPGSQPPIAPATGSPATAMGQGVSISSSQQTPPDGFGNPQGYPAPTGFTTEGAALALPAMTELQGSKIIARVGTEDVLAADVIGPVNDMIMRNIDRIPPGQVEQMRMQLVQRALVQLVQTKMIINQVRRKIPAEGFKKFEEKVGEGFDKMEAPKLLEKAGVSTFAELDDKLRASGSSLERERRAFVEHTIAMSWVQEQCKFEKEITYEQMLEYYQKNSEKYDFGSKARWEQIMVRFDKYPSKADAWRTLAEAGNRILGGASFAEHAKAMSDGPTAKEGGVHDWTTKGSLASTAVDEAIFNLPVGQLSPIIEDSKGFRIVRVLERTDAGRKPFTEVQPEIKKLIKQERTNAEIQKYVTKLQSGTKVWTIFDAANGAEGSRASTVPVQASEGVTYR